MNDPSGAMRIYRAVSYAGAVQQFHDATPANDAPRLGALFGWVVHHPVVRALSGTYSITHCVQLIVPNGG